MEPFRFLTGTVIPVADKAALGNVPTVHLPWCFGCGPENDDGLRLRPRFNGDLVEADMRAIGAATMVRITIGRG